LPAEYRYFPDFRPAERHRDSIPQAQGYHAGDKHSFGPAGKKPSSDGSQENRLREK
jgi:hypothetical protein